MNGFIGELMASRFKLNQLVVLFWVLILCFGPLGIGNSEEATAYEPRQCPTVLKAGNEFNDLVDEAVNLIGDRTPKPGLRRDILSMPPTPAIIPLPPDGVPCLCMPSYIAAIDRACDLRYETEGDALDRSQLLAGVLANKIYIVTHANDVVDAKVEDFLGKNADGPRLFLTSPQFPLPELSRNHVTVARYSFSGELPSDVNLNSSEFHMMGGDGRACELHTTWDLVNRLSISGKRRVSDSLPRIVVHTGLTYVINSLLLDYIRKEAGNSLKSYVQKFYLPWDGYQFEFDGPDTQSALGCFTVSNGSGNKVKIEYVFP